MDGIVIAFIVFASLFALSIIVAVSMKLSSKFRTRGKKYKPIKDTPAGEPMIEDNKNSKRVKRPTVLTPQANAKEQAAYKTIKDERMHEELKDLTLDDPYEAKKGMKKGSEHVPLSAHIRPPSTRNMNFSDEYKGISMDDVYTSDDGGVRINRYDTDPYASRGALSSYDQSDTGNDLKNLSPEMKKILMGNVLDRKDGSDDTTKR